MSAVDEQRARQALAWRLRDWGVDAPEAKARVVIDELVSRGWRMAPDWEQRPRPPKPHEACRDCGRHHDACACEGGPTLRVVPPAADTSAAVKRLRAVVDEATADHCSHHVPRTACNEHRPTRNEGDPA